MLRIPFPSTGTEDTTFFRGGKRARRDAIKTVMISAPIVILECPTFPPPARQPPVPVPAPKPAPKLVRIFTNLKRKAAAARVVQAPPPKISSPIPIPAPAPKARSTDHVSLALVLPSDHSPHRRGGVMTAPSAPKTLFRPEEMSQLPKVVLHSPVFGDNPIKYDHPESNHGSSMTLDVPNLSWRGRIDIDDLLHFFPEEWEAEHEKRVLRARERRARNNAARKAGKPIPTSDPSFYRP